MILVVADTGPICHLILIDAIGVLPGLFDRLVIPQAVAAELLLLRAPERVRRWIESLPAWAEVRKPTNTEMIGRLDPGESEAVSLALELKAASLLLDESEARQVALRLGLPVSGTIGVIEKAALRGLLDLKQTLDRLLKTNFRVDSELITDVLSRNKPRA